MEPISYEQFGKLRLRHFVPDPDAISETADWEWEGSLWFNEGIGFTSFSRHAHAPAETGGLEVCFSELPPSFAERLLRSIGLPLRPGMSRDEVLFAFGEPTATHEFAPDRRTYDFAVGSTQPYVVGCTIQDTSGLVHVCVIRPDLIARAA